MGLVQEQSPLRPSRQPLIKRLVVSSANVCINFIACLLVLSVAFGILLIAYSVRTRAALTSPDEPCNSKHGNKRHTGDDPSTDS